MKRMILCLSVLFSVIGCLKAEGKKTLAEKQMTEQQKKSYESGRIFAKIMYAEPVMFCAGATKRGMIAVAVDYTYDTELISILQEYDSFQGSPADVDCDFVRKGVKDALHDAEYLEGED